MITDDLSVYSSVLSNSCAQPAPGTWLELSGSRAKSGVLGAPAYPCRRGVRGQACPLTHSQHCPAGARWDTQTGVITEARLKELTPAVPVIFIKAIPVDRMETKNMYECPVYKTRLRGPTYVWTFNLKTKEKAAKWVLAGVALLLQI